MAHPDNTQSQVHAFDVVLRGYDRRQVDDHLSALDNRLAATIAQCNELRQQRDTAAGRAGDLEHRLNGAAAPGSTQSGPAPATPAPPASARPLAAPPARLTKAEPDIAPTDRSLDGFGIKVESILRMATEEAARIKREAEQSVQMHTDAGRQLRAKFAEIAQRLEPLARRLDDEARAARAAADGATSQAGTLESTTRQQAQAMTEAAAANATRMRADAQSRIDITDRQVSDVREELDLVTQILDNLDGGSATAVDPDVAASPGTGQGSPATESAASGAGASDAGTAVAGAAQPGGSQLGGSATGDTEHAAAQAGDSGSDRSADAPAAGPNLGPTFSGGQGADAAAPQPTGGVGNVSMDRPPPPSAEAPTETITMPIGEPHGGAGPNQPRR